MVTLTPKNTLALYYAHLGSRELKNKHSAVGSNMAWSHSVSLIHCFHDLDIISCIFHHYLTSTMHQETSVF